MSSTAYRAALMSLVLVLSSLAGCIAGDEEEDPTILVSTYHVAELVSAVAGDTLDVEIISPSNIPVHDYEPSAADIAKMIDSEMFFYHGLNLEPWVDTTLDALGEDAPIAVMTHTMPTGQDTLDYESVLISNLCEVLTEGPFESTTLGAMSDDHDDHDDHSDEEGDHDDHDDHSDEEGDHDDHDDHEGHEHAEAEETIQNPADCPADTVISIFHMEEGEYVLEFESEHDEDFNMAALKMPGGHAHHHHHGHGSGPFEWAGIFSITDVSHTWTMEKVDGSYADPSMRVVLIPTDTPTEETMHSLEDGVEALIEGDTCTIIEDGESMTPVEGGSCFEWHVGTGDISTFTIDTTGMSGFAAYTAHSPYEFEATQHYLKDSAGNDVEHVAEEGGGGHGDHGDHSDEHGDEHGDEMCHNTETHENYESTEEDCEAAGHMWMGEDHDDHHGVCHDTTTHENHDEYETEEECEAAGHMWMEEEEHDLPEIHADFVAHTLSFPEDDHDEEHNETDDHSDEEGDHDHEEGHHELGYVVIHIEEEGDYGFALPTDVEFFVLMNDDHDHGHGDGSFEWAGMFEMNDATHTWSMQKVDGDYADPTMWLVLIPTDSPTEETMHSLESGVDALVEAGCTVVEDGESMSSIAAEGSCFELHVGTGDDSTFTIDTMGFTGMAMYAQHVPTEFERDQHYLKDSSGTDIEPIAQEGAGAHDHGGHGDDHSSEEIEYDPHSWLSPLAFKAQADLVVEALSQQYPEHKDTFEENAEAFKSELDSLHMKYSAISDECEQRTVVANHNAYSYIGQLYDIRFVTVHGLDPEGEPSAADIAEVLEQIEEDGLTVLFVEEYTNPDAVAGIVEQTKSDTMPEGISIQTLYTMEMPPMDSEDNYLSLMEKNLDNLKAGMGC